MDMKLAFRMLLLPCMLAAAEPVVPSPSQVAWHREPVGLFIHWAPNAIKGIEGDDLSIPPGKVVPDRFDAGAVADAARAAGAGYVVFVAKHVGGWCAWPTRTTDYSIRSSSWKDGRGDMVGELAAACRRRGLRFGVYLSPRSDIHGVGIGGRAKDPSRQAESERLYREQLTEVLTAYGPMHEVWFDGGNIVPVNDILERLAPECITFQGRRPNSIRWVGTEHGHAPYPCWSTVRWDGTSTPPEGAGDPEGNLWCPAEVDVSILRPRWFWYPGSDRQVLSLRELTEIYYLSVGRGCNLLLNVAPDPRGEIPPAQLERLREFGELVRQRFGHPLAEGDLLPGAELALTMAAGKVDHVRLSEDIARGERVRGFVLEGRVAGKWTLLCAGSQVGPRQIIPFDPVAADALRVRWEGPADKLRLEAFAVGAEAPEKAYRRGTRR